MGPLVPDIIGTELNFVVALLIGIAFGFILEQAGFSTSKKLVGLFYGYDFTVLRVFFTAGVTAMIGLVFFEHYGLIDMDIVYINPTFLYSALVGGGIMGLGFVIGGFCPGTSFCAAAIGKKDAMVFIIGSFIGVLVFTEAYPIFADLYVAENWGFVRIFDTLGMSQSLFTFLLTSVALFAFWATKYVENRVNGIKNQNINFKSIYVMVTGIAFILGLSAFLMPPKKTEMLNRLNDEKFVSEYNIDTIDSDELALRFMKKDNSLQLFDLRVKSEFDSLSLPYSVNIELSDIFDKDFHKTLSIKNKMNVFIAETGDDACKAAILANELGYKNVRVLKGGMTDFRKNILTEDNEKVGSKVRQFYDTQRFRREANKIIPELIAEYKLKRSNMESPKKSKRVVGGC